MYTSVSAVEPDGPPSTPRGVGGSGYPRSRLSPCLNGGPLRRMPGVSHNFCGEMWQQSLRKSSFSGGPPKSVLLTLMQYLIRTLGLSLLVEDEVLAWLVVGDGVARGGVHPTLIIWGLVYQSSDMLKYV